MQIKCLLLLCSYRVCLSISHRRPRSLLFIPGQVFQQNLLNRQDQTSTVEGPQSQDMTYLGYSVASGRLGGAASAAESRPADAPGGRSGVGRLEGHSEDIVIGRPRGGSLRGQVQIYNKKLTLLSNITGDQLGSYFGYSVAVADLNGDQLDDIVVGAPWHTGGAGGNTPDQRTASRFASADSKQANNGQGSARRNMKNKLENGMVATYLQTPQHNFVTSTRVFGQHSRGHFGLSVTSLGDINLDGYDDIAVGAPRTSTPTVEEGASGGSRGGRSTVHNSTGAVYIFLGSKNGLQRAPAQVLWPRDLTGSPVHAFGWSVSGGKDLDGNEYPDLAIGAEESSRAFVLRARPVVHVSSTLTFGSSGGPESSGFDLSSEGCSLSDGTSVACLPLHYCLQYRGTSLPPLIDLVVELKLDTGPIFGPPRMHFLSLEGVSSRKFNMQLSGGRRSCDSDWIYVTPQIQDKLSPLAAELTYELLHRHSSPTSFSYFENPLDLSSRPPSPLSAFSVPTRISPITRSRYGPVTLYSDYSSGRERATRYPFILDNSSHNAQFYGPNPSRPNFVYQNPSPNRQAPGSYESPNKSRRARREKRVALAYASPGGKALRFGGVNSLEKHSKGRTTPIGNGEFFFMNINKSSTTNTKLADDIDIESETSIPFRTHGANGSRYVSGSRAPLTLRLTITNSGEDAYISLARVWTGTAGVRFNKFDVVDAPPEITPVCTATSPLRRWQDNSEEISCDIGNPFPSSGRMDLNLTFQPIPELILASALEFQVAVNSSNEEISYKRSNNRARLVLPVETLADVDIRGISWPDDVIVYNQSLYGAGLLGPGRNISHEAQVGPSVSHVYEVTNRGPSLLRRAQLLLLWPSRTFGEKPLLYLTKPPEVEPQLQCVPLGDLNYLDIDLARPKTKRSVDVSRAPSADSTSSNNFKSPNPYKPYDSDEFQKIFKRDPSVPLDIAVETGLSATNNAAGSTSTVGNPSSTSPTVTKESDSEVSVTTKSNFDSIVPTTYLPIELTSFSVPEITSLLPESFSLPDFKLFDSTTPNPHGQISSELYATRSPSKEGQFFAPMLRDSSPARRGRRDSETDALSCGASNCSRMVCLVSNLEAGEHIVVRVQSRLWVDTIEALGMSEVTISSRLVVRTLPATPVRANVNGEDSDVEVPDWAAITPMGGIESTVQIWSGSVSSVVRASVKPIQSSIEWIIILGSILVGLFLLALLILILWALGFFKRRRVPHDASEQEPLRPNGFYASSSRT
ncbi:FG-GAP repeat [Trinorchestia longiramus]|nr:FG-GAP repeat [Trinorchestia longiramus]